MFGSVVAIAGYDVHITRKAYWADNTNHAISYAEWMAYVDCDEEVFRDELNSENDFIVVTKEVEFPIWYESSRGELYTKNPSAKAIRKMSRIARKLKAKVQGDNGETFPVEE